MTLTRLLWKEARERRLQAALLMGYILILLFIGTDYTYSGGPDSFYPFLLYMIIPAIGLGASAFQSEVGRQNADFLYTKPVRWSIILLSKALVMFGMIVAVSVLGAIAFKLILPAEYQPFVQHKWIGVGIIFSILLLGIPCLIGMGVSLGLPGTRGGVLTLALVAAIAAGQVILYQSLEIRTKGNWSTFGWIFGPLVPFVILSRFGVTLSTEARFKRYAIAVPLIVLFLIPLDFNASFLRWMQNNQTLQCWFAPENHPLRDCWLSPDLKYALRINYRRTPVGQIKMAKLPGDQFKPVSSLNASDQDDLAQGMVDVPSYVFWTPSGKAYWQSRHGIRVVWMGSNGRPTSKYIDLDTRDQQPLLPSPTGRYCILGPIAANLVNVIVDVENLKAVHAKVFGQAWWQSDNTIGYRTLDNQLHTLKL